MTDVTIRNARIEDAPAIHSHMRDFAEFENLLDSFTATADELKEAIFAAEAFINCLVAEADGGIQGYAIFFPYFSSFRSRSGFYLEDLYVAPNSRGKKIGHRLLETIAKLAADRGFS